VEAPVDLRNAENELIGDLCPQGNYCPNASSTPLPCLPGTYSAGVGNTAVADCLPCTPGHYCDSLSTVTPLLCAAGSYCPLGSKSSNLICDEGKYCPAGASQQTDCDEGTYQDKIRQSTCDFCPAGSYCPRDTVVPIDCPIGSYCLNNTRYKDEFLCPPGTFSNRTRLTKAMDCYSCIEGSYCETAGQSRPTGLCDEGYYCTPGSDTRVPNGYGGDICPAAYYCPQGSPAPVPCPPGTNSTSTGLASDAQCGSCPKGYYCPDSGTEHATLLCPGGYFCPGGVDDPASNTTLLCPKGHRCPLGTSDPAPCSPGSYQTRIGQDACDVCPPGYYCLVESSAALPCVPGHYCLESTTFPTEFPCPAGFYTNATLSESVSDCRPCQAGQYCSQKGLVDSEGPCDYGYFCGSGSAFSSPFESGVYGLGYIGETCVDLTGSTVNDKCPPGHFCPVGSAAPRLCPPGTNSTAAGLGSDLECGDCPKGYYCPESATVLANLYCPAGYYCPGGVANPADSENLVCPTGSRCPVGSDFPVPCDAGTYQDERGNDMCKTCSAGYFCLVNTTAPLDCPIGQFCPNGTRFADEFPCPPGTFSNVDNLRSTDECEPCLAGQYCDSPGLTAPTGPCAAGYFCGKGSSVANPHAADPFHLGYAGDTCVVTSNSSVNDICPPGHYCPEGSPSPVQCPPGTNTSSDGLTHVGDCQACVKGYYCPSNGTVYSEQQCLAGYYCPSGTSMPSDFDNLVCPTGSRCPVGSDFPVPCDAGTYQDERGNDTCKQCPIGFFCAINSSKPILCPSGYYCPTASNNPLEFPCPAGTYNPIPGLRVKEACLDCVEGSYCETPGLSEPTGLCAAGYYCGSRAITRSPLGLNGSDICSPGHYCPEGSVLPTPCPAGTNSTSYGLHREDECGACSKGYYCPNVGTVKATLLCIGGYYCPGGVANPATNDSLICPPGHQCPEGSNLPLFCESGTYQVREGQTYCNPCAAGFYCSSALSGAEDCPPGHYCPEGTTFDTEYPCPVGTFSTELKLPNITGCTQCTPGHYCEKQGQVN
jgi:hypothetical protein